MRDRSMRSGAELAQDIQLTDWSRAREHVKNLSNQFSGVQISCVSIYTLSDLGYSSNLIGSLSRANAALFTRYRVDNALFHKT